MVEGQIATNLMLNRLLSKVEIIETYLKNKNTNVKNIEIDIQFLSNFPIRNAENFVLIEDCIENEFEFALKLVAIIYLDFYLVILKIKLKFIFKESYIKNIGGNGAENHIKRIMSKLFTDEFSVKMSWTGRGWVKDMTKLKDTNIIQIVKSND